ncbi:MAG: glycosyltransferase [Promethearchaeota archaeon]
MNAKTRDLISVIVPIHKMTPVITEIRKKLTCSKTPFEAIFVIEKFLKGRFKAENSREKVVVSQKFGRGFSLVKGALHAKGDIILFLHSDTLLPPGWDEAIKRALFDEDVVGGGFSVQFDNANRFIKFLVFIYDLLFHLSREMWGDRAIFIRSRYLREGLSLMYVPLMEDVRLSLWMRKKGRVVLLKEKVTTSASSFVSSGPLRHTISIVMCRIWYALGGDLQKIYRHYYLNDFISK